MKKRMIVSQNEVELLLRHLHPKKDAKALFELVKKNRAIWRPTQNWVDSIHDVDAAESFLDSYELQSEMENGGLWGLEVAGQLQGAVIMQWIQWEHKSTALGYWLSQDCQGKGYATLACNAIIKYAFEDLKLHRVEVEVAMNNDPSINLLKRLGFTQEGLRRSSLFGANGYMDSIIFGLLRNEYQSLES